MFNRLKWYAEYLQTDPVEFLLYAVYFTVVILLSLILHEIAHGYIAYRCGDPTAKMMGRLSLDPRKHLSPLGTVCMLVLGFGWAKPVPVNPYNLRRGRRDDFFVSIAGICMNLTLMIVSIAMSVIITRLMWPEEVIRIYSLKTLASPYYNIGATIAFGPVRELTEFMTQPWLAWVQRFFLLMGQINVSLALFNLLPIPPLDGFHLLNDTLLQGKLQMNANVFQIAQIGLIVLCMSGALGTLLSNGCTAVYDAVLNLFVLFAGGV